jgi:hypothetical protein
MRLMGADDLDGWRFVGLADGRGPDGKPKHWMLYEHPDGREASVLHDGRSTDPELQALLQAGRAAGEPREQPRRKAWLGSVVIALTRRLLQRRPT